MLIHEPLTPQEHARASRQPEIQSLIQSNLLGLKLNTYRLKGDKTIFIQNYAVVAPANPIGAKIFIHGRELFTPETAEAYFKDPEHFDPSQFSEASRKKIRHALSPDGFMGRREDYNGARTHEDKLRLRISELQEEHGWLRHEKIPEITSENLFAVETWLDKQLEKHGENPAKRKVFSGNTGSLKDWERPYQQRRDYALALMKRFPECLKREEALRYYLKKKGWDPEIVLNFQAGVKSAPPPGSFEATMQGGVGPGSNDLHLLEAIIKRGLEVRTNELLMQAAKQMENPYDSKFVLEEQKMAENLVANISPRKLRAVLQVQCAIIGTNHPTMEIFSDLNAGSPGTWKGTAGFHLKLNPHDALGYHDFAAFPIDQVDTARHEFGHALDCRREMPFADSHDDIDALIREDRERLNEIYRFVQTFNPDDIHTEALTRLRVLAGKRKNAANDREGIESLQHKVSDDIDDVRDKVARFMEADCDKGYYQTKRAQHDEIPAVLEELMAAKGKPFIKALMPNLTEAYLKHFHKNHLLRDKYACRVTPQR